MKNLKKITLLALLFWLAISFNSCSGNDDSNTSEPTDTLPTLTSTAVSAITQTTATSGGNVTDAGSSAITARGICWATTQTPTIANSKTTETGTTGSFTSNMTALTANTTYYVRAYATNSAGTAYGNEISFITGTIPATLPIVTTTAVSAITLTTATSGGNVTSDGGGTITARGICYATIANPTISNTIVTATGTTGTFSSNLTALTSGTTYYVRAYATNSAGTGYGTQVTFITSANGPTGGNAICDGTKPTVVVPITSSTGKIWMDRNLGASRAANTINDYQAYGCLYQWGRGNDGHASMTWTMGQPDAWGNEAGTSVNGSTTVLSTSDNPGNALFIKNQNGTYDWRSPKNDNLWQGVNGINNPCPSGYRIPTRPEFVAEISAYSITNTTTGFNSIHKLPNGGSRGFDNNVLTGAGSSSSYWTSTTSLGRSYNVSIQSNAIYTNVENGRAGGYAVRCIKN